MFRRRKHADPPQLDHPADGHEHDAGQGRLGQTLKPAGQEQRDQRRQAGRDDPGHLGAHPLSVGRRRLREARADRESLKQPGADVRRAEPEQFLVLVQSHPVLLGEIARDAAALGEVHQRDSDRRSEEQRHVGEPHVRNLRARQGRRGSLRARRRRGRPGRTRVTPASPNTSAASADGRRFAKRSVMSITAIDSAPTRQRRPVHISEVDNHVPQALPEVAAPRLNPEQARQLLDRDQQRQSGHEAHEHRGREELGHAPKRNTPASIVISPTSSASAAVISA